MDSTKKPLNEFPVDMFTDNAPPRLNLVKMLVGSISQNESTGNSEEEFLVESLI